MRPVDADVLRKYLGSETKPMTDYGRGVHAGFAYAKDFLDSMPTIGTGWVSCDERLPEQGIEVIVAIYGSDMLVLQEGETPTEAAMRQLYDVRRVTLAHLDEEGLWSGADWMPLIVKPKYWMPKPEAPELPKEGEV